MKLYVVIDQEDDEIVAVSENEEEVNRMLTINYNNGGRLTVNTYETDEFPEFTNTDQVWSCRGFYNEEQHIEPYGDSDDDPWEYDEIYIFTDQSEIDENSEIMTDTKDWKKDPIYSFFRCLVQAKDKEEATKIFNDRMMAFLNENGFSKEKMEELEKAACEDDYYDKCDEEL